MQVVANNLVGPDDVTVSLTDIGGLQSIIHRLVRVPALHSRDHLP